MFLNKYADIIKRWGGFYRLIFLKIIHLFNWDAIVKFWLKMKFSFKDEVILRYQSIKYQIHNTPINNLNLSKSMFYNSLFKDAILRGKIALFFRPDLYEAYYYIGRSYYQILQFPKAAKYLNKYIATSNPRFKQEAEFCLKSIDGTGHNDILEIPRYIVESNRRQHYSQEINFEEIACIERIFVAINEYIESHMRPYGNAVLDLNCGFGRFGELFKENKIASSVEGCDIAIEAVLGCSALLIHNSKVYNNVLHLIPQECVDHHLNNNTKFDIIVAHNLLSYLTNAYYFLIHVRNIVNNNGIIVLTFCLTSEEKIPLEIDKYSEVFYLSVDFVKEMITEADMKIDLCKYLTFANEEKGVILVIKDNQIREEKE